MKLNFLNLYKQLNHPWHEEIIKNIGQKSVSLDSLGFTLTILAKLRRTDFKSTLSPKCEGE